MARREGLLRFCAVFSAITLASCGGGSAFNGGAAGAFSSASMSFAAPSEAGVERRCLRATSVDGVRDPVLRRAIEEALGALCAVLQAPSFAASIERAGPWFSRPDSRCVALEGPSFVEHLRAAERVAIAVVINDEHRPAATALLRDGSARIELASYQVRRWLSAESIAAVASRAELLNTLAHELVHVVRDDSDPSNPRFRDDSEPNDYVRSWLGSYRFGDFTECSYLALHEAPAGALAENAIARCMNVRQNGRNLGPRTRSDYLRECASEQGPCARWTRALSTTCRAALRVAALRASE